MPTYTFLNKKTKKIEEHVMSITAYDAFKQDNPHLERYIDEAPPLGFTAAGDVGTRTDNTWKEVLSKISEKHPSSALAQQHGKRTIKEVKTREVFDKHMKRARNNLKG